MTSARDTLMTTREALSYLGVSSPIVLRRLRQAGRIPGLRIGDGLTSPWRYRKSDLDKFLAASAAAPPRNPFADRRKPRHVEQAQLRDGNPEPRVAEI